MDDRPPSVDALARSVSATGLPQPLLVDAARSAIADGRPEDVAAHARSLRRRWLMPVVNATGVLLHTNLGRAPMGADLPVSYSSLEIDLDSGRRGSRTTHAGHLLARACGAESALVVNNGAAAVLLVLAALARGKGVAVSRGELVEIGGGFRLPEVMEESGARLVEVGTTNRTRIADYARVADEVAVVLKVHRSNFQVTGFVEDVDVRALSGLGRPLVVDLGSGLLDTACPWLPGGPPPWLRHEPAVRQSLAAGADVVVFSGDKLLGGPQAGIIAGDPVLVEQCSRHPLYRVLRPGDTVLSILQQVAVSYLARDGNAIPFWRMATVGCAELHRRATAMAVGEVVETESVTGGGTLPGVGIASVGVSLPGDVTRQLREASPKPVIARVVKDHTILDLRTVDPDDDAYVAGAVAGLSRQARSG